MPVSDPPVHRYVNPEDRHARWTSFVRGLEDDAASDILAKMAELARDPDPNPLQRIVDGEVFLWFARDWLASLVAEARAHGYSWASIGGVIELTGREAQQRFGDPVLPPDHAHA